MLNSRLRKIIDRIDESFIKKGADRIKDEDLKKVFSNTEVILDKIKNSETLNRFWHDGEMLVEMIRDYWNGVYTNVPYRVIAGVAFALLYVLNPFDLIPDLIPGIGLLDDSAVLGLVLILLEGDLDAYRFWKQDKPVITDAEVIEE